MNCSFLSCLSSGRQAATFYAGDWQGLPIDGPWQDLVNGVPLADPQEPLGAEELRQRACHLPIIMLTARSQADDQIEQVLVLNRITNPALIPNGTVLRIPTPTNV